MTLSARDALDAIAGLTLRCEEPLSRHGSLRMGGAIEFYAVAHTDQALLEAARIARRQRLGLSVFTGFSELAGRGEGVCGLLVRLGSGYASIERGQGQLRVGVGAPLASLGVRGLAAGFPDYARLATMPGTVGEWMAERGVSAFGQALLAVRALTGKGVVDFPRDDFDSIPKRAIPLSVTLEEGLPLLAEAPAPRGALFASDAKVRRGMDRAGLLGLRLRQLRLSTECPGVVVNLGRAAPRDLDLLRVLVRDRLSKELDQAPSLRLDLSAPLRSAALRFGGTA